MRLIDADALIEEVWHSGLGSRQDCVNLIKEMPTKEERPHGEWNTTPNPNYSPFDSTSEVIYMCSQCAYSSGDRITETWHYCPNCGADMREIKLEGNQNPCIKCDAKSACQGICKKRYLWNLRKEGE